MIVIDQDEAHIFCPNTFCRQFYGLWDN